VLARSNLPRLIIVLAIAALAVLALLTALAPDWWMRLLYRIEYREEIARYSRENHLDPYLVAAVIQVESGFDPHSRSQAGAVGLMQLLPDTGREVAERLKDDYDPERLTDPETNIRYGTWYLGHLTKRYESTVFALAAYNGGGANMDQWRRGSEGKPDRWVIDRIPFKETREFVGRVIKTRDTYRRLYPDLWGWRKETNGKV